MKKKILLIEDEAGLRILYRDELEEEGYEVVSAGNGEEGIRQFEKERPDLVVLDIVMPVMDGLEALKRIRKMNGNHTPVILHTSHPKYLEDPDIRQANALILKSADLQELKVTIAELLKF
jgi:CheY-like chemotaxis protein